MKNFVILLSFALTFNSFGQDLNNYSHVVIPEKFSFLKEADQYQLNSLTKFLFEKYGFEAYLETEENYVTNNPERCEGLHADVLDDSGMFNTKLQVVLKDCRNKEIFVSREGVSRLKDFRNAYQEALRNAFESIEALNYTKNEVIVTATPDLEMVQSEVKAEKNETNVNRGKEENLKKMESSTGSATLPEMNFTRDGKLYFLIESNQGYNLFQQGMAEPFATLIRSSSESNYIYNSMTSKGMAHFDNEKNLIIETLEDDGNSLKTVIYKAEDQ